MCHDFLVHEVLTAYLRCDPFNAPLPRLFAFAQIDTDYGHFCAYSTNFSKFVPVAVHQKIKAPCTNGRKYANTVHVFLMVSMPLVKRKKQNDMKQLNHVIYKIINSGTLTSVLKCTSMEVLSPSPLTS
ncbi:hypothetical protein HanRHA438_Chr08g0359981 [Helianthus annuus]|nr:hypothetical protein HanRHA438_Chr08g0359981 [Helianthus annuus]